VVVASGETSTLPFTATLPTPLIDTLVAPLVAQLKVEC
jgi:hypothetical protein